MNAQLEYVDQWSQLNNQQTIEWLEKIWWDSIIVQSIFNLDYSFVHLQSHALEHMEIASTIDKRCHHKTFRLLSLK